MDKKDVFDKLADHLGQGDLSTIPKTNELFEMFDILFTPEQAEFALQMPLARTGEITVEDLARKMGKPLEAVREVVEARAVVSNAGPKRTMNLAGPEHFDDWYVKQVRENVKPSVAVNYIFVSDKPLVDGLLFTTEAQRTESWWPTSLIWIDLFIKMPHNSE